MTTNPGEQVTLRANIVKATKAAHIVELETEEATNSAKAAAKAADRAEEALNKADPKNGDYNNIVKSYNDAKAVFSSALAAETKAWRERVATARDLDAAKAAAKAAYAI